MNCIRLHTFRKPIFLHSKAFELGEEIKKIGSKSDLSCLALFILTHGEENGKLHAYDRTFNLNEDIIDKLLPQHCPNLAGKPKLVFIQACQGEKTDPGTMVFGTRGGFAENLEWYEFVVSFF